MSPPAAGQTTVSMASKGNNKSGLLAPPTESVHAQLSYAVTTSALHRLSELISRCLCCCLCSLSPAASALAALAAARAVLASFHSSLTPVVIAQLRLRSLHHLAQAAHHAQQAVAATCSLHPSFPSLLTRQIDCLTQAVQEAGTVVTSILSSPFPAPASAASTSSSSSPQSALLPLLTSLLSSLHSVLSYLPSTHSICPAPRAALYQHHIACLLALGLRVDARNAALLYLKHLPSALRPALRQLWEGGAGGGSGGKAAASEKEETELLHARIIVSAATQCGNEYDGYRLILRACDAVTAIPHRAELLLQAAHWMQGSAVAAGSARDVVLHAIDLLHSADPQHPPLPPAHHDGERRRHARMTSVASVASAVTGSVPSSARTVTGERMGRRGRGAAAATAEARIKTAVSTGEEERKATEAAAGADSSPQLGMRELSLLVRCYAAMADSSEREEERLQWSLVSAHHVQRMWLSNAATVAHHLDEQRRQHERLVNDRARRHVARKPSVMPQPATGAAPAGSSPDAAPLPAGAALSSETGIPPLVLPEPPAVPSTASAWLTWMRSSFPADVRQLMEKAELRPHCLSSFSLPQPLLLFSALAAVTRCLQHHGLHASTLPLLALQLLLLSPSAPNSPPRALLCLVHLRIAALCDRLCEEAACRHHLEQGEAGWMPTREELADWDLAVLQREREERVKAAEAERKGRSARQQQPAQEEKQQLTSATAPALAASLSAPAASSPAARRSSGFPPSSASFSLSPESAVSLPSVYLQLSSLLLSFGRHGPARILCSLAIRMTASDCPLSSLLTAQQLSRRGRERQAARALISTASQVGDWAAFRCAFPLLLRCVMADGQEERDGQTALDRAGRLVQEAVAACEARLQGAAEPPMQWSQCLAHAQALHARWILEAHRWPSALPPLPLTASALTALQLDPASTAPLPLSCQSHSSLARCQQGFQQAFSLLSASVSRWLQLQDTPRAVRLLCRHAAALELYARMWSTQRLSPRDSDSDRPEEQQPPSLQWPHLVQALTLWLKAEELQTALLMRAEAAAGAGGAVSSPARRQLSWLQSRISLLYADLYRCSAEEAALAPAASAPLAAGQEAERQLLRLWEDRYEDVFSSAPPPPPSALPALALARAASALLLHDSGRSQYALGRAELCVLDEEREEARRGRQRAETEERRRKERAEWKARVYANEEEEREKAEQARQAEERRREEEESRRMRAEEEARAVELTRQAEEEERKRREEEAAAAAKAKGGKKAAAALGTPKGGRLSKEEAAKAEAEREEEQRKRQEEEKQQRERAEAEAMLAEDAAFASDSSEWSPLYLLAWKREVERERLESRLEAVDEGQTAQGRGAAVAAAGGGKSKGAEEGKRRRHQSMSMSLSDDDDGLDPTILIDPQLPSPSLSQSAYSHLLSSLRSSLLSHDFQLVAAASLSLLRLFTTRQPLLSSKYLALHQSAVVSAYVQELTASLSPRTAESLMERERQRLTDRGSGGEEEGEEESGAEEEEQGRGGWCLAPSLRRVCDWLDDSGLVSQWTRDALSFEEEKEESVLRGWDACYAGMLVSIPSSVSIITLLYCTEERAFYLSLLSSDGFPLSSRFSRTVLTEEEEETLYSLVRFFSSMSDTLAAPLAGPPSAAAAALLSSLDAAFVSNLGRLDRLLTVPFQRALLTPSLLQDRDLIILPCPLTFPLPFEALPLLTSHQHRSLCRDFSFAFFNRRMETSVAEPISRDSLAVVVGQGGGGGEEERAAQPLISALAGKGLLVKGRAGEEEWRAVMQTAQDSGAVFYVGDQPLLDCVRPSSISGLDCREVRLAVLMDRAVRSSVPAAAVGGGGGGGGRAGCSRGVYDTCLLLSVRGVNSVLCHQWSISSSMNCAQTFLAAHALASGQSVASVLRLLTNTTDIDAITAQSEADAGNAGSSSGSRPQRSPQGGKANTKAAAAATAIASPKAAKSLSSPKAASGSETSRVREEESKATASMLATVRAFDRYNSVLVGLPHWRM